MRGEMKENFNFSDSSQDYFLSQIRIHGSLTLGDGLSFFVEGQDARIFGEDLNGTPAINEDARPNIYVDKLDVHQAYLDTTIGEGIDLRIGRQKFNFGDKRLVASLEWLNTARVWDGVRATVGDAENRSADIFHSRVVPVDPNGANDYQSTGSRYFNSTLSGIFVNDKALLEGADVQYWWLWRESDDNQDSTHTFGGSYFRKVGELDTNFSASVQTGEFGGVDHQAYMIHAEAGKAIEGVGYLSAAYNFATGDDNASDNEHGTFDNLYPLNHAYYGYMDLFALQNIHNVEAVLRKTLQDKYKLRLAYQAFWLDEPNTDSWYNAGMTAARTATTAGTDSYVGSEIDLTVGFSLPGDTSATVGASRFLAGDYVEQTGAASKDPTFFFLSLARTF